MNPLFKNNHLVIVRWLDYSVITLLAYFCLQYVRFTGRDFAEISVRFEFLDFPIFIGEFVLGICLGLVFIRMALTQELNRSWFWLVAIYAGFIFFKAYAGYNQWGPLALRDAALFYYVFFAWIGFVTYRPEIFRGWTVLFFYAALGWLAFDSRYNGHWLIPRLLLGSALAWRIPDRRWGMVMALGVMLTAPYQHFFDTSRANFLGNFAASIFLLMAVPWVVPRKSRHWVLGSGIILVLMLSIYSFFLSTYAPVRGIIAFKELNMILMEARDSIRVKAPTYQPMDLERVKIYNPNVPAPMEPELQRKAEGSSSFLKSSQNSHNIFIKQEEGKTSQSSGMKHGNTAFRILIWEDARDQLLVKKPLLGFDFGKPFRSPQIEMVRWALDEWTRDGWIAMHNSYLNLVYRSGLVGVVLIVVLVWLYVWSVKTFILGKSLSGLLVCASLLVPLVEAFFSVTFELPYMAIPIWTLFGMMLACAHQHKEQISVSSEHPSTGSNVCVY